MVEPCNCLGDFQYVHVDCWSEWLNESFDERDMGCQRCESNWNVAAYGIAACVAAIACESSAMEAFRLPSSKVGTHVKL